MTAKVVGLHSPVMATSDPCEDVIRILEEHLEMARRGEIVGIMLGSVEGNGTLAHQWASGRADRHLMLAASTLLHHEVVSVIADQEVQNGPSA